MKDTGSQRRRYGAILAILGAACLALVVVPESVAASGETKVFRMHSRVAFAKGTLDGVGLDSLGTLRLADRVERLAQVGEPFLLSAAPHPEGWVVGTGNAGKVLLVTRKGETRVLFAAEEAEIFAVWASADGTVYAGSSPDGKVYRIAGDEVSVFFEPQETYIWGLAGTPEGALLVATGTRGMLYRVSSEGKGEVLFDSDDTHLRVMRMLDGGEVLLGTAGEGLILKLSADGSPRTLYDAPHPEIVSFACDSEGTCYAALLASEASLVSLGRPAEKRQEDKQNGAEEGEGEEQGEVQIEVTVGLTEDVEGKPVGSRPAGFPGPRSQILKISKEGVVEILTSFQEETVYSLLWHRGRLWIGSGLEGKIFSLQDHRPVLEKDVDERQVVALLPDSPGPAFATTNAASLYRISGHTERRGSYTSPALDAEQMSRFGALRWQGQSPEGTAIRFSFRSGMSSEPDRTWTAWSPPRSGREISLSTLPSGRYVQWRAELEAADDRSPTLSEVTLSYRQANLPPRIESLAVLDPGQILVPANFNPAQQTYEPAHPNREGIFTTIEPTTPDSNRRLKTLWKRGYRTLRWEAEDPNGDDLVYRISFRREDGERPWLPVTDELRERHYSFDATVLPDGRYRFRLEAADRDRLDDGERRQAEEVSEPVLIDHSPPSLGSVRAESGEIEIVVEDRWNPVREAVFSIDAKEWKPVDPVDGLLDGQRETLRMSAPEESSLLLLRVTDAAFNVVTFDLSGGARR